MTFRITQNEQEGGATYAFVSVVATSAAPGTRCFAYFDGVPPGTSTVDAEIGSAKARKQWIKFFEPHPVGTEIECEKVQAYETRLGCGIFSLGACTVLP